MENPLANSNLNLEDTAERDNAIKEEAKDTNGSQNKEEREGVNLERNCRTSDSARFPISHQSLHLNENRRETDLENDVLKSQKAEVFNKLVDTHHQMIQFSINAYQDVYGKFPQAHLCKHQIPSFQRNHGNVHASHEEEEFSPRIENPKAGIHDSNRSPLPQLQRTSSFGGLHQRNAGFPPQTRNDPSQREEIKDYEAEAAQHVGGTRNPWSSNKLDNRKDERFVRKIFKISKDLSKELKRTPNRTGQDKLLEKLDQTRAEMEMEQNRDSKKQSSQSFAMPERISEVILNI